MISKELKSFIKNNFRKEAVVCLTGAGISAESGVPTFRGKDGLWSHYDPDVFSTSEGLALAFKRQPLDVAGFVIELYSILLKARPNPAHLGLSALEKDNILSAIITQNVDNLHQKAGSRNVIELHGNAFRIRCRDCGNKIVLEPQRLKEMVSLLKAAGSSRLKLLRVLSRYFPRCKCGGRFRIDIVLFGEMLPQEELSKAYQRLDKCKVLLLVGTSLVVYPAASLPVYAKEKGATLIEINNEPSALSNLCDYRISSGCAEVMPQILNILGYA
ncbi:MAG: NAD-dependent protein deacylase [Candidatus Omnitrophota bacterium]|nr:MAG: NAD-dependent protein deacylase [Candidatus Omnitrophota bacterium]